MHRSGILVENSLRVQRAGQLGHADASGGSTIAVPARQESRVIAHRAVSEASVAMERAKLAIDGAVHQRGAHE